MKHTFAYKNVTYPAEGYLKQVEIFHKETAKLFKKLK